MALPETPGQRISDLCNGNHITQEQELHTVDDVTALVTEQIGQVMPLDEETSEQFQQLMKKKIEQAGKQE